MAFSAKTYTGDGSTTDFAITFDYLDETHVNASVENIRVSDPASEFEAELINSTTIRITHKVTGLGPNNGDKVEVFRETPITNPAVIFGAGASLTTEDLNKLANYITYALQEATDENDAFTKLYLGAFTEAPTTDNDGQPILTGAIYYNPSEDITFFWNGSEWKAGDLKEITETFKNQAEAAKTAAEAAQSASETALDDFTDIFLGAKASEPTLDNDGDALQDGALFKDTTAGRLKYYDSATTTWKTSTPGPTEQTNIDTVATDITDVTTVSSSISDVNTVSANIADVNTVAGVSTDVTTVAGVNADVQTLADLEDGTVTTGALSNLGPISTDITTVSGISGNVTTVAGISTDVTTVSGISTEVTTVAANDANVTLLSGISSDIQTLADIEDGTSATDAIQTVAGISTNVTAVASNNTDVSTVATSIADVNTVAADITDVTTVSSSISDVTNVSTNIATVQDAAADLTGIHTAMLQMATSFTNSQERFVSEHAFS